MGMSWFGRMVLAGCWCVALAGCAGRLADAGAGTGADGGVARQVPDDGAHVVIGGERDAHGCLPAAGYTFSVVRNGCIRVFESGVTVVDPGRGRGFRCSWCSGRTGSGRKCFCRMCPVRGCCRGGGVSGRTGGFRCGWSGASGCCRVLPVRRIRKTVRACGEAVRR